MSERTKHESIGAALCAAMADVGFVVGTGWNDHHKYNYTSDIDLIAAVRPAMVQHGLAIIPHEATATREGSLTTVHVVYLLVHADTPQTLRLAVVGEGSGGRGSEDKGAFKALTGAYKYLLRHTFAVATGDDAEASRWNDRADAPETDDEARARRAKHDNDWEDGGRGRFMGDLAGSGLSYDALALHLSKQDGAPKMSEMGPDRRKQVLDWLATDHPARAERLQRAYDSRNDD